MLPRPVSSRRRIRPALVGAVGAAALLVTACGGPTIHHSQRYADWPTHYVTYASDTPYVATRIIGNPFGAPESALTQAVTAGMARANPGFGLRYTTDSQVYTRKNVSMAVLFGGTDTISVGALCSVEAERFALSDSRPISVKMALCYGSRPLSTLTGSLGGLVDPGDPRFETFVKQMTERLYENTPLPGSGALVTAARGISPAGQPVP